MTNVRVVSDEEAELLEDCELRVHLADVCPILKGLSRVKRARDKAEYMRKWHEQHDLDWEVQDGEDVPSEEEDR